MAADDTLVNGEFALKQVSGNGPPALVMRGGQSVSPGGTLVPPERQSVETWAWNGRNFVRTSVAERLAAPVYRFQAIRQGDDACRAGKLGAALALYDQVLMDETLLGWNPAWLAVPTGNPATLAATSLPTPAPDPAERHRLEAYARYRMMLLYVVQGYKQEAQIEYTLLQEGAADGSGAPYARLAAVFWEAYLSQRDVGAACSQAVEFARAHAQDILAPLGNRFYGSAYPEYTPEEICPFW